jgi:hypothetical protein
MEAEWRFGLGGESRSDNPHTGKSWAVIGLVKYVDIIELSGVRFSGFMLLNWDSKHHEACSLRPNMNKIFPSL